MKKIILILAVAVVLIGCKKDKYNTKPTLKYKGVNNKTIFKDDDLKFDLNVTDLEGDLTDTLIVLRRVRNCNINTTVKYKMPIYPTKANLDIDILVAYTYGLNGAYPTLNGPLCNNKNDSTIFRFVIKDKAGNVSDTVSSEEIVMVK